MQKYFSPHPFSLLIGDSIPTNKKELTQGVSPSHFSSVHADEPEATQLYEALSKTLSVKGDRNLLQPHHRSSAKEASHSDISTSVSDPLQFTCSVQNHLHRLEVCCAYQHSIQSLWNFSLGVKTMQLSSDRRPVLEVPSYTYGSTHHFNLLNLGRYNDSLK